MLSYRNKYRLFNYKYENNFLYILFKFHYHFFHSLISRGRKIWAFNFFIHTKYELKKNELIDPLLVFFVAMTNLTPEILLFPLKLGGLISEVAMPISIKKQIIFSTKWVIKLLKDKFNIIKISTVSKTLLDAIRNVGVSIDQKDYTHTIGKNNRFLMKYFK